MTGVLRNLEASADILCDEQAMRLLSPRELAEALGVSESSLKRWVDSGKIRATKTEGGHRRIALVEAVRFVRDTGSPVARPELLDMPEIAVANQRSMNGAQQFLDHLLDGDVVGARGWLLGRYLAGATIAELCDGPVRDAMTRIGELWTHDERGVYIEHRATDVCLQALAHLRGMLGPTIEAPLALGGTPAKDPYLVASFMAATVIAAAGVRAMNLGPDTPLSAMKQAVHAHQPRLVWVSASAPMPDELAREFAQWMLSLPRTTVAVCGGREATPLADAGVRRVASMTELASIAGQLLH